MWWCQGEEERGEVRRSSMGWREAGFGFWVFLGWELLFVMEKYGCGEVVREVELDVLVVGEEEMVLMVEEEVRLGGERGRGEAWQSPFGATCSSRFDLRGIELPSSLILKRCYES